MSSYYDDFFMQQIGGQYTDWNHPSTIKKFYVGAPYQRGRGIGSFLGGLFRKIFPVLTRGAKAVGREALRAGANIMDDIANRNVNPAEAIHSRVRESGLNLKRKAEEKIDSLMTGQGRSYKYKRVGKFHQSGLVPGIVTTAKRSAATKKKKKKQKNTKTKTVKKVKKQAKRRTVRDIFG